MSRWRREHPALIDALIDAGGKEPASPSWPQGPIYELIPDREYLCWVYIAADTVNTMAVMRFTGWDPRRTGPHHDGDTALFTAVLPAVLPVGACRILAILDLGEREE